MNNLIRLPLESYQKVDLTAPFKLVPIAYNSETDTITLKVEEK